MELMETKLLELPKQGLRGILTLPESVNIEFPERILVEEGDHDLQTPPKRQQWVEKAVEFLSRD